MSNNIKIRIQVQNNGKLESLDAQDKISLKFEDENGKTVGETKPMSLDEFKKTGVEEFKKAFPKLVPKIRELETPLYFQSDLPNKFSLELANAAVAGKGHLKLDGTATTGIEIYAGWDKVDPKKHLELSLEDFFGVKKMDSHIQTEIINGDVVISYVTTLENKESKREVRDVFVYNSKQEELPDRRHVVVSTFLDDNGNKQDGYGVIEDTYFTPHGKLSKLDRKVRFFDKNGKEKAYSLKK